MLIIKAIIGFLLMWGAIMIGAIATYKNVKNAQGPKERAFVIRISIATWIVLFSMLLFVYYLPSPHRYWVLLGYFVVCPILVYNWSTMHQLIRMVEQRDKGNEDTTEL